MMVMVMMMMGSLSSREDGGVMKSYDGLGRPDPRGKSGDETAVSTCTVKIKPVVILLCLINLPSLSYL